MKKIAALLLLSMLYLTSFSQDTTAFVSKDPIAQHKTQWGFNLGFGYTNINYSSNIISGAANNGMYYCLGLLMNREIGKKWAISPRIGMSFANASVPVPPNIEVISKAEVYPVILEFGLYGNYYLKDNKKGLYVLAGGCYKMPWNKSQYHHYATEKSDISIDAGIGFTSDGKNFRFCPEVKYSYGLINHDDGPWNIRNLRIHTISLTFNFRG